MERDPTKYVYCLFYLEKKSWKGTNDQLKKYHYKRIKAIIPTVNILRKIIKGKMIFTEEPVLFNYGFIRIPRKLAYSRTFMNKLRKKIPGIHSWLRDTETLHSRKKRVRIDNAEDWDDFSLIAMVDRSEVRRFIKIANENKKYSLDDLVNLKPGDYIHLKGYPYEGVEATVKRVDYLNKQVTVETFVLNGTMKLTLPFDNVLYSVYLHYDPDIIQATNLEYNPDDITQDKIDRIMDKKQY